MHLTKHACAVWSSEPGGRPGELLDGAAPVFVAEETPIVPVFSGEAVVAGYTGAHGRDGAPERGVLVVDVPSGGRAYAVVTRDELLADAESCELVGQVVRVAHDGALNVATW
jgi:acetyl-CoA C-acetyltransferase